ncbi:MAG: hypothetical protein KKH11_05735 [Candidatus Omnitrophica bacterium]|nr:hypothetical protein [Candidatus Omnitrophota bacterium]MBU4140566.1 hypothetical protein [Candidatus Omnitrophota bacterium]
MKAFLVGLLFLFIVAVLAGMGVLLFPFLLVLGWIVRVILIVVLLILVVWLLGKLILYIRKKMR